ncbi:MAG: amidohydrolase family protein [Acidobacteria bacterium]|jgi:imidazolonepropionase-like amidohydrolase|nr:amidohydrolase family protein [Acidobacteriota bacterium]OQB59296.1 MAG: imidazolonepropionase [Candidatus Aminicenantes bacterium ADurb.Bin147]HNQ81878.1 amidohydrolase family protein [Candidatus Aminicenantes bacterium]MDD8029940.1 amidohydrolase family protein [Acidobacteriota bacterium]NMD11449.1 amidohydrolase family protein [Acidobacteriota bacterium]
MKRRIAVFVAVFLIVLGFVYGQKKPYSLGQRPGQNVSDDPRRIPMPEPDLSKAAVQVLRGATLIDGTGANPISNAVIVIRGNRIQEVGRLGQVTIPEGAALIPAEGKYILPGMIDLHTHITYPTNVLEFFTDTDITATLRAVDKIKYYSNHGITSLRDVGSRDDVPFRLKEAVRSGLVTGPRIFPAGKLITGTGGHGAEGGYLIVNGIVREANGADDFRKAVREQIKAGADCIKLASHYTLEEAAAAIDEAHQMGLRVTADSHTFYITWAVQAGIDGIDHPLPRDEETIRLMAEKGTCAVPTIVAYYHIFQERGGYWGTQSRRFYFDHAANMELLRRLKKAGIKTGIGTDVIMDYTTQLPKYYLMELRFFLEAGYTPMETIIAATRTGAEILGMADKLGTIEKGKLADLIVVEENPLEKIDAVVQPSLVMVDGKIVNKHGED